jgi:hypothetical protein
MLLSMFKWFKIDVIKPFNKGKRKGTKILDKKCPFSGPFLETSA